MGDNSKIQWTTHTWNPWQGCIKFSPGCKFCYMYRDKHRWGQDPTRVHRSSDATFNAPLKWKEPGYVFTCSWSDWFIEQADEWREDAWDIIRRTPHLTYQILTKRPERAAECLPNDWPLPNAWLGVSVEDQQRANERIPVLAELPATVRFLSIEPLLSPLLLCQWTPDFDWVIVGGESGADARPLALDWVRDIRIECETAGIPLFVKQLGTVWAKANGAKDSHGGNMDKWPEDLRVREMPTVGANV